MGGGYHWYIAKFTARCTHTECMRESLTLSVSRMNELGGVMMQQD